MITKNRVEALAGARVLVVGDLIIDRWLRGTAERLSPEAPVPVIRAASMQGAETWGGAGNVLRQLRGLQADAELVCARDVEPEWRVPIKTRVMAGPHQVCRIDCEEPQILSSAAETRLLRRIEDLLSGYDAIAVADYGKGTIPPAIARRLVTSGKPVLVDCKQRWKLYSGATLVKPNLRELADIVGMPLDDDGSVARAAHQLLGWGGFGAVLVTMGANGMKLVSRGNSLAVAARNVSVADVTGAGDAVLAALTVAIARGWDFEDAVRLANGAGALAVSKPGTTPVSLYELAAEATEHPQPHLERRPKIVSLEDAQRAVDRWRASGVPVYMVNGCFDLLHDGHRHLLGVAAHAAAAAKAHLVAAVNDDSSVTRMKGHGRPIEPAMVRAAGLDHVDFAVVVHDTMAALTAIRPDKVFKGDDHTDDDAEGRFVKGRGGEVVLVPRLPGHSTTQAIARLRG